MAKSKKLMTMFLYVMAVALLLQGIVPVAYASSDGYAPTDEVTEVDFSDETQKLNLTKGKNYLLSYPVSGKGWAVSEIRYSIAKDKWELFDEDSPNDYITVERCEESKTGMVQIIVKCKTTNLIGLNVTLENEITGEKKGFSFAVTVALPQPTTDSQFLVIQPPFIPDGGENPDDIENPDEPETPDEPDDGENKDPIIIDTTGWSFDAVTTVYDGTEYTVTVTGLPDYVTPVYSNNTRTNAGTQTAHVSFLVPEGYVVPADMETTITIEKAPIYVITGDNLVQDGNGLKFSIPEGALPDGITYSYEVNNVGEGDDYAISNPGSYIVSTDFQFSDDFSEEMRENYITNSTAIYNVQEHEDTTPSKYGLDFVFVLEQQTVKDEVSGKVTEVHVNVNIKFENDMAGCSSVTYVPVFDSSVLEFSHSEKPSGINGGNINQNGIVSVTASNLITNGFLHTLIFNVADGADISNLPFSVKDVEGAWISPDFQVDHYTGSSTSIIVNPDVDVPQYSVTLPAPSNSATASLSTDMPEGETVAEDIVEEEITPSSTPDNPIVTEDTSDNI